MQFIFLADKPDFKPQVAQWFLDQWGHLSNATLERNETKLSEYLNREKIPLMILAMENNTVMGCAYLCFHEMSIYQDKEHWVGGVYVEPPYRGKMLASKMVLELERIAKQFGVEALHLQTEDLSGGLYAKLGFEELEQVNYRGVDVSVRRKILR